MRTSPATVHKTLAERGLVKKAPVKVEKNPSKLRFFESARPNQLWQSDILTIRLGGNKAYLIGFIDDYSRYMTSLGLYRSQTAEHVLETYRRAVAEISHVTWLRSNLAWAMDDCRKTKQAVDGSLHLHNLNDLIGSSRRCSVNATTAGT